MEFKEIDDFKDILIYSDKGIITNIRADSKQVITIDNIIGTLINNNKMDKYTLFILISGLIRFYLINEIDLNNYDDTTKIDNLFNLFKRATLHDGNDDVNNIKEIFLSLGLDAENDRKRL